MHRLTLLQLGDFHYDQTKTEISVDAKDHGFPGALGAAAVARPLQAVIRQLVRLSDDADAVVIVGDLTTAGCLKTYEECVDYLTANLRLADPERWRHDALHVVPGNHDVDRALVSDSDLVAKFAPLEDAWMSRSLPVLATRAVRATTIGNPLTGEMRLLGLNSSIGCGERRLLEGGLPEATAVALHEAVTNFVASASTDSFGERSEILDTPSFLEADVDEVAQIVDRLPSNGVPVLIAHHNLTPQALPRFAPYSELINGGMFRSRLSGFGRPVVYLHGHIHTDPVEVVSQHLPGTGSLILVSAPLITKGFNALHIEYTRQGYPIGLIVDCWRLTEDGGVSRRDAVRIPLETRVDTAAPITRRLIDALASSPVLRFRDLRETLGLSAEDLADQALADAVLEAEWFGFVVVEDRDEEIHRWRIRGRLS